MGPGRTIPTAASDVLNLLHVYTTNHPHIYSLHVYTDTDPTSTSCTSTQIPTCLHRHPHPCLFPVCLHIHPHVYLLHMYIETHPTETCISTSGMSTQTPTHFLEPSVKAWSYLPECSVLPLVGDLPYLWNPEPGRRAGSPSFDQLKQHFRGPTSSRPQAALTRPCALCAFPQDFSTLLTAITTSDCFGTEAYSPQRGRSGL